jgi:hypothetical protein
MFPSLKEKKSQRLDEWRTWLVEFVNAKKEENCIQIPYAAENVNNFYWRVYSNSLKPLLNPNRDESDHNLHYYKIISASELAVMSVLPIDIENVDEVEYENKRNRINAEFALMVGLSIMLNWKFNNDIISVDALNFVLDQKELMDMNENGEITYPVSFAIEHIQWLIDLNVNTTPLPLLINSQVWRLFFLAVKFRTEIIKNKQIQ